LKGKTVSNWTALKQGQSICNGIDFGQGSKILFKKRKQKKLQKIFKNKTSTSTVGPKLLATRQSVLHFRQCGNAELKTRLYHYNILHRSHFHLSRRTCSSPEHSSNHNAGKIPIVKS